MTAPLGERAPVLTASTLYPHTPFGGESHGTPVGEKEKERRVCERGSNTCLQHGEQGEEEEEEEEDLTMCRGKLETGNPRNFLLQCVP